MTFSIHRGMNDIRSFTGVGKIGDRNPLLQKSLMSKLTPMVIKTLHTLSWLTYWTYKEKCGNLNILKSYTYTISKKWVRITGFCEM